MAECPENIEEFLNFDFPSFTASAGCEALRTAIAIAEMHLVRITMDPCAFDELEFGGVPCSGANKAQRITAMIRTWYELIKCKTSTQHCRIRKQRTRRCAHQCKGTYKR